MSEPDTGSAQPRRKLALAFEVAGTFKSKDSLYSTDAVRSPASPLRGPSLWKLSR